MELVYATPYTIYQGTPNAIRYIDSLKGTPYQLAIKALRDEQAVYRARTETPADWNLFTNGLTATELFGVGC